MGERLLILFDLNETLFSRTDTAEGLLSRTPDFIQKMSDGHQLHGFWRPGVVNLLNSLFETRGIEMGKTSIHE